jgi:hypothetical protein
MDRKKCYIDKGKVYLMSVGRILLVMGLVDGTGGFFWDDRIMLLMGFVYGSNGLSVAPLLEHKKMRQTTRRVLSAESFSLEHLLYSFRSEEIVLSTST